MNQKTMSHIPSLRQKPYEPDPSVLVRYEIIEKISTGTLPVEIVRYGIPEPAGVLVAKSTSGDQKGHSHGHSKDDGERERETLEIK